MTKKLTVIDFFCGAGGFSEGFKQAGFDTIYATDFWTPAVETFKFNNPDTEVTRANILELEPDAIPRADIVIGGPPCTEFSGSKRGGHGDFEKGLVLVKRYLYFIHSLKPRWWIMENVPRLLQTLPSRFSFKELGVKGGGYFQIPKRQVFCAADFGAPQKRTRLLSGVYPDPIQTHAENANSRLFKGEYDAWVPMRRIIEAYPDPLGEPSPRKMVVDPIYPKYKVREAELEDHFGEFSVMTPEEAERNRKQKVAHAYYGKMKFPDDLDRPARTVMATSFNASRETMILEAEKGGKKIYRKPTIRECASLQCYPIDYKFIGANPTVKYKLVGNSVPALLSYAIAKAIKKEAGIKEDKQTVEALA